MIYLSKLVLDPYSRRVRSDISNIYELHRTIMRAFPKDINRKASAVLFRLDHVVNRLNPNPLILVQSIVKPEWDFLENIQYLADEKIQIKTYQPIIKTGNIYRFKIHANPTRRSSKTKKLIPIVKEEELLEWIAAKGKQNGFLPDLSSILIRKNPLIQLYKKNGDENQCISLAVTAFSGFLKITDPEKFTTGLTKGIGRGRSFGCGLLSIAKI